MNPVVINVQKMVSGGYGLGFSDGHPVFVWNALPGETVTVNITRKRKGCWYGTATGIIKASPSRVEPKEDHFLSCSPWQIIDYAHELTEKQKIIQDISAGVIPENLRNSQIISGDEFGYRNKLEMSFTDGPDALATLAFHNREVNGCTAVPGCILADQKINSILGEFQEYLYRNKIVSEQLKNLVIRSSTVGQTLASLYVTHPDYPAGSIGRTEPSGYEIIYSDPRYSDTVLTEKLYEQGELSLTETVSGKIFMFSNQCFFQVNIPLFENALADIRAHVGSVDTVYDLFSGVGAIGLSLDAKSITLVELEPANVNYANHNLETNGVSGAKIIQANATTYDGYEQDSVLICDPPRSGLTPKMIDAMLRARPRRIIYLSCNPVTQMRDVKLLLNQYKPMFWRAYNFFPRTPHIETLIVLERTASL